MIGRLVRRALIRLADLIDDRVFGHRYMLDGFCADLGNHPWWDL